MRYSFQDRPVSKFGPPYEIAINPWWRGGRGLPSLIALFYLLFGASRQYYAFTKLCRCGGGRVAPWSTEHLRAGGKTDTPDSESGAGVRSRSSESGDSDEY